MTETMTVDQIRQLALNHREHRNLPFVTNAAFIKLEMLESFLSQAKTNHPDCDTLQINFIRYDLNNAENWISPAGENLSQVSLQLFPVKVQNMENWQVTLPVENLITTFCFCPPVANYKEGVSGICPPRGNCEPVT